MSYKFSERSCFKKWCGKQLRKTSSVNLSHTYMYHKTKYILMISCLWKYLCLESLPFSHTGSISQGQLSHHSLHIKHLWICPNLIIYFVFPLHCRLNHSIYFSFKCSCSWVGFSSSFQPILNLVAGTQYIGDWWHKFVTLMSLCSSSYWFLRVSPKE